MDLIAKILSLLPVKFLLRFRCVDKSFDTLISDPYFLQMHLKNSKRKPHIAAISYSQCLSMNSKKDSSLVTFSISCLLENPSTNTFHFSQLDKIKFSNWHLVGSCNGLLCLIDRYTSSRLLLWNPATRTKSEKSLISLDTWNSVNSPLNTVLKFSFGYDNLTKTYKVVAFGYKFNGWHARSVVIVFSLWDNSLRYIEVFPMRPLERFNNNGVYLSGTVNWLALCGYFGSEQYVILSIDLSTETYTQLLLPRVFVKERFHQPSLVCLMGCICFSHYSEETHFVIWQMKDFGVQESWIQLFKISYHNFLSERRFKGLNLLPLYLSENSDTLILANTNKVDEAFIYNYRDNRVEEIGSNDNIFWTRAKDYFESLVSIH